MINTLRRKEYAKEKKKYQKYGLGIATIKLYGFKLALEIYESFKRKCSQCGEINDLTIHHLDNKGTNFSNLGLKKLMNNDIKNLVLLCRSCHGRIHAYQKWENYYRKKKILNSSGVLS
jgi:5-methylcytosine-specific restriction endonuclease McrA